MTQTLRSYQSDAVCNAGVFLSESPLIVAPTGAGKTTIGVHLVKQLLTMGYRVCWIAHRTELIEQAVARFNAEGVSTGVIKGSVRASPLASVQVASIQTLARRDVTDYDVYVIDEAHRATADSYMKSLPRHAIRVGLTATPYRLDGRGLGCLFGRIVETPQVQALVDDGYLLAPEVWCVRPPSMQGVKKRGGDFAMNEAEARINLAAYRADICDHWHKRMTGKRTLCFAASIVHSNAIVDAMNAAGIRAMHVDGNTPEDERADAIERLRNHDVDVLSNVLLFTEGFDLPEIEGLIIARPTASLAMHMQMVGRVMRPHGSAVVHDHVNNHVRLGPVTQQFIYTLDDAKTVRRANKGEPLGLRTCASCFRMYSNKQSECPSCGEAWASTATDNGVDIDGEAGMQQLSEHGRRELRFNEIAEQVALNGWKDSAVLAKYHEEFDEWPPCADVVDDESGEVCRVYVNPETAGADLKEAYFRTMLQLCIDRGWKHGAASHRYKELFGKWPTGFVSRVKDELGVGEDADENKTIKELW